MCTKTYGPITRVIQTQIDDDMFVAMTGWMYSAGIKNAQWQAWSRDPSGNEFLFKPAYQLAQIDPKDPDNLSAVQTKNFAFTAGSGSLESGYGYGEGGFLSEWESVEGTAGATPGTLEYFWIRFGVVALENDDTSPSWEKSEISVTVAVTDEDRG